MNIPTIVLAVATGGIIAGAYGFIVYLRRRRQEENLPPEDREGFNPYKLGATVIVGAVWGGLMAASGQDVTYERVQAALVTYIGVVAGTEALLKFLVEEYRHWRG